MSDTEEIAALFTEYMGDVRSIMVLPGYAEASAAEELAEWLVKRGVSVVRAAPREPSPEALRAALDIWAPGADYDFTVVAAAIRAAYAVDGMGGT